MRALIVTLVAAICATTVTNADESLRPASSSGTIDLGRVFMSPAERQELDRLRKVAPTQMSGQGSQTGKQLPAAKPENDKARAAGYIVPSSGSPYRWRDGDFQRTTRSDIDSSRLPGGVSIIRHKGATTDARRANSSGETTNKEASVEAVSEPGTGHDAVN
mgnify:CR=1 FL=1